MSGVVLMSGVVQVVLSMDCWLWEIKNLLRAVAFSIAVAAVELAVDSVGIVCLGGFSGASVDGGGLYPLTLLAGQSRT